MAEDAAAAYALIKEQGIQIAQMAKLLESHIAIREAHSTILQSLIPFVKDNPDFRRIVTDVHTVRLSSHLERDVSNDFIERYTEAVNALLPSELRFPAPSVEF